MRKRTAVAVACLLFLTACQSALPGIRQDEKSNLSGTLRVALLGGAETKERERMWRLKCWIWTIFLGNTKTVKTLLESTAEWQPDIIEMTPAEARTLAQDQVVSLAEWI
ncbi:MAG: hypothetical protein C6W55_07990 [Thermobacillus sp.]|uniref:Uncharacterized protein n=1 Tax=Thermobacillus composti (strain DSM 18247 / JCM 13945 / KWC4) TaxID=717605 RepID=L0EBN5_THECK|nr:MULTISPECIES: hypothetical protein [Thermobacillus]AGA57207.1 hypothetical protein Theco_1028 [Thermobacillus composti KWC4]REK56126.1 MAG: hypothetical protein C6W55_07990 [Thermobacillus sp.]